MSSSEKKFNFFEQEINNLKEQLNLKSDEVVQLRGLTYELENFKSLQKQCEDLNGEKC